MSNEGTIGLGAQTGLPPGPSKLQQAYQALVDYNDMAGISAAAAAEKESFSKKIASQEDLEKWVESVAEQAKTKGPFPGVDLFPPADNGLTAHQLRNMFRTELHTELYEMRQHLLLDLVEALIATMKKEGLILYQTLPQDDNTEERHV